jgi:hypothetical protein
MPKMGCQLGVCHDYVAGIVPLDLQTARDGDWVNLKNYSGCEIVVFKGAGTAGDDPDITIEQATDAAGTDAKVLNAITRVHKKQGTLTAVGTWTTVSQTADELYDADATSAEEQALYVFSFATEMLDVDGGFDWVRVRIADVGTNAQLGCALYVLVGPRYPSAPASLPNAIA